MLKISYIVNSVFSSRTYVLSNDEGNGFWLVDCGDMAPLMTRLSSMGDGSFEVKGVLLTHAHYDHIYGLPSLLQRFPACQIFTNAAGVEALASPKINMSRYHEDPIAIAGDNVRVVREGDWIPLAPGVEAQVFETPGHNPSCLTFLVGKRIFTGDAFIPGEKVVTTLPGGNKELAADSLERILVLSFGREVLPGHDSRNKDK